MMKRVPRTSRRRLAWGAAAAALAVVTAGCGPDRPTTAPVTGTVTYSGKPLEGVDVMFAAKDGGRPARGKTDASGRFTLQTFEASDGALVGEHTVVFSKVVSAQSGAGPQDAANAHSAAAATRETLPRACTSIMDSPFKVTVTGGKENDFTFDLANPGSGKGEKSSTE